MDRDKQDFQAMKYDRGKKFWYYTVPTTVRRSGRMRISNKKAEMLIKKYGPKS